MSSIETFLFKATIGWLVNKGRDVTAEKLKEGDVTDKKVRDLIVREVKDIKSKLDGLSRKDLLVAVDSFETGVRFFFQALDVKPTGGASTATEKTSVAIKEENVDLTDVVKVATKIKFSQAEKRFKMAREEATKASNNEALEVFDRITAIQFRVMAAILESVVETARIAGVLSPETVKSALENALNECDQCLQKLHCLPAVQDCFKVGLEKGLLNLRRRFGKDERRRVISTVCQVNRAIYNATQAVGRDALIWPFVDTGEDKVDPLRDRRIPKVLRKVYMEHCCVKPWSLGQEGEEEHKLKRPCGIATNHRGQFLIADDGDKTVKVFDSNGKFDFRFNPQTDDADTELDILDVATAGEDERIYLLVRLKKPGAEEWEREVQVFNKTADLQHKFPVRRGNWNRLTVSSELSSGKQRGKILLLARDDVHVYEEPSGKLVCSFGRRVFKWASDITATCDGRVMIVHRGDDSLYIFDVEGHQLGKFKIKYERDGYYRIACHPASDHVVLAGQERETDRLTLAIYTVNGEFVRRIQLDEKLGFVNGITVTVEGHIAVALQDIKDEDTLQGKVIVV
ncbi:unnamed protein product [Porites lobata]|uniref:Uncharacterized protein n=1 Tax=Porites lobata TaxID=104759 RepID=A0ABN8S5D5_9CNID|nr:unnamed protein product [Porites lobata]